MIYCQQQAKPAAKQAFTLVELMFSAGIVLLLVSVIVTFLVFMLHQWRYLEVAADMRAQGAMAVEHFKGDLSFSSPKEILLSPNEDAAIGMSFPILSRADHSTAPVVGDEIDWTHTVIYHLFTKDDGTHSLRRTLFTQRDNSLTDVQRVAQLQKVIASGNASRAINGRNAVTTTVIEEILDFKLSKGSDMINARDQAVDKPKMVHMGVVRMTPGKHRFRFETADTSGIRQNIGIDALYVTPSGSQIEGEAFVNRSSSNGGTVSADSPVASHNWENNAQLLFTASYPGAYVEFDLYNDMWMEAEFAQAGAETERTRVTSNQTTGQVAVALDGMDVGWQAEYQVAGDLVDDTDYAGAYLRMVILGNSETPIGLPGERLKVGFTSAGLPQAIKIESAAIMERVSGPIGDEETMQPVTFNDGNSGVVMTPGANFYSDWVNLAYDPAKDYLITLKLDKENADVIASPLMVGGKIGAYRINHYTGWEYHRVNPVRVPDWTSLDQYSNLIQVESLQQFPLIADIFVSYPATGTYTSRIFDTKLSSVGYDALYGTVSGAGGAAAVRVKVRSASDSTMAGAPGWDSIASLVPSSTGSTLGAVGGGRFVQFRAEFTAADPFTETAQLLETAITWAGPEKIVDLGGQFTFGASYGKFKIYMDGNLLNTVNANMDFKVKRTLRGEEIIRPYHVSTSSHQVSTEE